MDKTRNPMAMARILMERIQALMAMDKILMGLTPMAMDKTRIPIALVMIHRLMDNRTHMSRTIDRTVIT